jgi:hypothetical protein
LYWTEDSTDLLTLSRHWLTASESLESLQSSFAGPDLLDE